MCRATTPTTSPRRRHRRSRGGATTQWRLSTRPMCSSSSFAAPRASRSRTRSRVRASERAARVTRRRRAEDGVGVGARAARGEEGRRRVPATRTHTREEGRAWRRMVEKNVSSCLVRVVGRCRLVKKNVVSSRLIRNDSSRLPPIAATEHDNRARQTSSGRRRWPTADGSDGNDGSAPTHRPTLAQCVEWNSSLENRARAAAKPAAPPSCAAAPCAAWIVVAAS